MAGAIGYHMAAQVVTEQREIAEQIQDLVTCRLVGITQLVVDRAVRTKDQQIARGRARPEALATQFDSLGRIPLMVLRGQNSDLLSEATVAAMRARRSAMETVTVPDQGHAPILSGPDLIARLAAFVATCESARPA